MDIKSINITQADIIFKALHYVCVSEGIEVNEELEKTFQVLAEINPMDTNSSDCLHVMDQLKSFISNHDNYIEYFEECEEDQEEE